MTSHPEPTAPEAWTGAATLVRLDGADALDVLHRISTQSLTDLEPGAARWTLFCDFRGRLLHRASVARTADGTVWLARDDAPADELIAHLERHVFREDVRITNLNPAAGPVPPDPSAELERIHAGRPRHGHEIAPDFNPFEVGLGNEVHLSKGCYTGQEALMRLVTYRSVRRGLACLEGRGEPPPVPADVFEGTGRVGRVTSAAREGEKWIALGVIRLEALGPDCRLTIAGAGAIDAVVALPSPSPLGLPG